MNASATALVDVVRQKKLLEPAHLEELSALATKFPDGNQLGQELVRRGWLTSYQADQLLKENGQELVLGSYVLLDSLGKGGMGEVFKARHQTLNRIVAVKLILKDYLKSEDALRRFQREIQVAARLSHPNIVLAYDAVEVAGTLLFVMEYVDGVDLARLVKERGPLPMTLCCDVIRQVALGLQYAHERGLVHRDIKPHNLIMAGGLEASPEARVIKILDMGTARLTRPDLEAESSTSEMTQAGVVLGTPDYIAPEQAGEAHAADIRSDLYSLGCTFYQLLAGWVPFPGGNMIQKLRRHDSEEPVAIEQVRHEVAPEVASIVRKLMAKKPEKRYQTPAELAAALEPLCGVAHAPTEITVDQFLQLLTRSRLVLPEEVGNLRQQWAEIATPASDATHLGKWLVEQQWITEYQAQSLLRGRADHFFINEYKLLDRIGKGKRAAVYKALHRLGQMVAIKVLPPVKVKDAEAFGRFQREARMALRLNHPNVVRTLQAGRFANLHYLVMEYLEGETLDEVLGKKKQLTPAEAAEIGYQTLLGLQHLHEMSIVHRDLKPANLMLVPAADGDPAQVKILDLGLGRPLYRDEDAPENAELTKAGSVLGSPYYLAPEQAADSHAATSASDIYSLGCILYHALAGQPPFVEKNVVKLVVRHASEPPRPLREHNPQVPEALQQIVEVMLAKAPAARYQTPELAAQALRTFLQSQSLPIAQPRPTKLVPAYASWLDSTPACPEAYTPAPVDTVNAVAPALLASDSLDLATEVPHAIPYVPGPGEIAAAPVAQVIPLAVPVDQPPSAGQPPGGGSTLLRSAWSALARLAKRRSGRDNANQG
jgi:serine/threonine protein kinase